ncbi:MAG: UDP-N-acetylmuramoyl-L-alanine--D-glutamate ligase [Paludibacteraceae bacterium]|jgi:UDP-N-acetylmuramoylalanine--D-glutamate ligase|nr:UDP-N-acetylmuramoyl-L-alanine--D-glutamate ligase [Paludibacteraceae bacterium]MBQ5925214.1 UDP-N-acetylmuramoyl-L-alanine--D-glutamate ligase [Paludibacteraceae bacterium]
MRIVILGAGESGVGSAILAQAKGFDVFVSDMSAIKPKYKEELERRGIPYEELQHTEELILNASEVIKSPGIPEKAPIIKALRAQGTPIVSEIEFASRYTDAKTICITGSNGKTTTTMLTYHILCEAGYNVGLAGNVGRSFAWQVAEQSFDYYVIELSSFQLDGMYDFRADVAILLNITPDHLDRYEYKFQNYIDSKFRILQNMTKAQTFVYWSEDPVVKAEIEKRTLPMSQAPFDIAQKEGNIAWIENEQLMINFENEPLKMDTNDITIKGTHNMYNSMAAAVAANVMGVRNETIRRSLATFQGVEHRLEYVATIRGVRYINDSKATNVNSCWYALQSMKTPVVLILGGTDKGNDYSEIASLVREKVHTLIFMGLDNKKLNEFFTINSNCKIVDTNNLEDAVRAAYEVAQKGDTVLLSPCCASFDLFKNYEDRGEQFKAAVKKL